MALTAAASHNGGVLGSKKYSNRNSSIELLKVFAIFLIVLSHVLQTLNDSNHYVKYNDYIVKLGGSSLDFQSFMLALMRYGGIFGVNIFFICSAWFLLDKSRNNKEKLLCLAADNWVVSVLWLIGVSFDGSVELDNELIVKSLFPTLYSTNWYVTLYIVFSLIFPMLNMIVKLVSRRMLLRINIILLTLFVVLNYVSDYAAKGYSFQGSPLFLWITIYFLMAYLKKYRFNLLENRRFNISLVAISVICQCLILIITDFVGLGLGDPFDSKMLEWNSNYSPFAIMFAFGIFNLARQKDFKNSFINYASSLSLLIYIIHENLLFRSFYRPLIWHRIYNAVGYDRLFWLVLAVSAGLFTASFIVAAVYKATLQKIVTFACARIYPRAASVFIKAENKLLRKGDRYEV